MTRPAIRARADVLAPAPPVSFRPSACQWTGHLPVQVIGADRHWCLRCEQPLIGGLPLAEFAAIAQAAR